MPRLPDANDLGQTQFRQVRQAVNVPTPDIAGAMNNLARGVADVGDAAQRYAVKQDERVKLQERFDTRMGLLKAKQNIATKLQDLDPLDPQYADKVRGLYKENYAPVLTAVQHPENKQYFDESTYEDFVSAGMEAEGAQKKAFAGKSQDDILTYADGIVKQLNAGTFKGDPAAEIGDLIESNQYLLPSQKAALQKKVVGVVRQASVGKTAETYVKQGVAVVPTLRRSIDAVSAQSGAPAWMPGYLARLATIESSGGVNLETELSSAAGPYAFTDATGKQYGLATKADKNDFDKSTKAAIRFTLDNYAALKNGLGREPTQNELYLAHQQGSEGALKLLRNPDMAASAIVGEDAIANNGGWDGMSAEQFVTLWESKFDPENATLDEDSAYTVLSANPDFAQLSAADQAEVVKSAVQFNKDVNRAQEEERRKQRDEIFSQFTELESENALTQEWIDAQVKAGIASPREIRTFQQSLARNQSGLADDPKAVEALRTSLASAKTVEDLQDVEAQIGQAFADGDISRQTRSRLTAVIVPTKRILGRKNSFYSRGLDAINNVVKGDDFGGYLDPAAVANNKEQAIAAYDNWLEANPNVDAIAAVKKAGEIAKIAATDTSRQARQVLPVPSALTGRNRLSIGREDIVRAAQSLVSIGTDIPGGKVNYLRQAQVLKQWISVIEAEEALNDE